MSLRLAYAEPAFFAWRWMRDAESMDATLHRIARAEHEMAFPGCAGVTVCGLMGTWEMPGLFSRLGAKRCWLCCKVLGIPGGKGNPYNEGIDA